MHAMKITLKQCLRCFAVLAEEQNYRRAARRLHLSLPALNTHIHQLEETFGIQLCQRHANRACLTMAGELLLKSQHPKPTLTTSFP